MLALPATPGHARAADRRRSTFVLLAAVALFVLGGVPTSAVARSRPIPAEPNVAYATYWGGSGAEGCGPTRGADGSLYVTCGTDSPNLPRVGGIQSYQGQGDGYIAKLDRTGKHIVYATYLGSPGQDQIQAAAVDAQGHLYISGFAANGFPTTPGAYDTTFNGAADCCDGSLGDAFVAELSADGSRLLYSTFIGGSSAEAAGGLALRHDGSVVITGLTGSADFPTTAGAVESTFHGGTGAILDVPADAFAAKLNPSGSRLVYSTYLGGSGDDAGSSVALDHAGNAYYAGLTGSPEFPTTPGALKTSLEPGTTLNGFVTKLDPAGRLKWSTYLGGNVRDSAWGIDVDSRRHVYVSGSGIGGFPVTAGAVQGTFGGERDWFVAKLDRRGSSLEWATYLGGSGLDGFSPMLRLDRRGHADVVGPTASTNFPTTPNAFQPANAGGFDLAIVQLDRNGRLRFSSYLGGSGDDDNGGAPPALDRRGNVYAGGVTSSTDFPVTPDAIQPTYGGGEIDGLLAKVMLPRWSRMDAR
jgi:Beta-propeller repeat